MKLKVAVAVILCCVIAGVAAASYNEVTAAVASHGFTLTASGRAWNPRTHHYVTVRLSVRGTADGKLTTVLHMYVAGGTVQVQGFQAFPVSRGYGTLVQRCHYIMLAIRITSGYYGGYSVYWVLRGTTRNVVGKTLPVSFYAYRVMLPAPGTPQLRYMTLKGTLALS